MSFEDDVAMVVKTINEATALGGECNGMAMAGYKSVSEWKEIFNEAAAQMKIDLEFFNPSKEISQANDIVIAADLAKLFAKSSQKPVLILVDATNTPVRDAMEDEEEFMFEEAIYAFHRAVAQVFPQAILINIADGTSDQPFFVHSMEALRERDGVGKFGVMTAAPKLN
ncbi:MAG: hypothetical protein H6867_09625 [Rhodospirillales bacterium]|nr:hypothetical protein [Rhodospirillales bacterium]MCB9995958.1 hypothetical protein [Rhodospirillales bacterium]